MNNKNDIGPLTSNALISDTFGFVILLGTSG
jgi:hypothetical protein